MKLALYPNLVVLTVAASTLPPVQAAPLPTQQAYVKASNSGADGQFGWSVAISGNTMVIGAPGEKNSATGVNGDPLDNSVTDAGAAYVFVRDGNNWVQQAYLKASAATLCRPLFKILKILKECPPSDLAWCLHHQRNRPNRLPESIATFI